jgi:hypothetical protein
MNAGANKIGVYFVKKASAKKVWADLKFRLTKAVLKL